MLQTMLDPFYGIGYAVILNSWLFLLMGWDKRKAQKHQWRIPEKRLLLLGLFGGGLGGLLGIQLFRHKTREPKFKIIYSLGCFLMIFVLIYFF
ncbi:MAG: DUF1294 domain-containing protein [Carnobacterium sp.]|uniref:DUF1294 domain-containing protein n=1 Tax=Carnobacterium sp. TaxID=48221 RepID=UPI002FCC3E32